MRPSRGRHRCEPSRWDRLRHCLPAGRVWGERIRAALSTARSPTGLGCRRPGDGAAKSTRMPCRRRRQDRGYTCRLRSTPKAVSGVGAPEAHNDRHPRASARAIIDGGPSRKPHVASPTTLGRRISNQARAWKIPQARFPLLPPSTQCWRPSFIRVMYSSLTASPISDSRRWSSCNTRP